jgi:hypothetical protein
MREVLSFYLENNTSGLVPVSLFGNNSDPMDNSNATTQYQWNTSSLVINTQNWVSIQFKSVNESFYSLANIPFGGGSLINVVNALNTLSIGAFFLDANKRINNYNNNIQYANLTIYNSVGDTIANYSFSFSGVGFSAEILKNSVSQVLSTSPSSANGQFVISGGDTILFNVTTGGNVKATNYFVFNLSTNSYLVNNYILNGSDIGYSFVAQANCSYLLGMQN